MVNVGRLVALGLSVALLGAQQQAPVFRAVTKLVEVTVTVLDKKGNPVAGLEPADFTLLDEGKRRPVAFFRFDGGLSDAAPVAMAAEALPPGMFSNQPALAGNAPSNVTALVLDTINTPPQQSVMARAQMMRYLRALAPQTVIAIFLMGRQLHILQDFTDDAAVLRAKLEKATLGMPTASVTDYAQSIVEAERFVDMFAGDPAMQEAAEEMARNNLEVEAVSNAAAQRYRMEQSLAAMEALGTHLAGIQGRKILVWIGGGFSMLSITGNLGMGPRGSVERFDDKVRQVSQRLAQQGIVLYIVDSKGIELPSDTSAESPRALPPRGRGRFEPQMDTAAISSDTHPAMQMMASITGGRYLYQTNDLTSGFKQAAADLQGSYTLGFYMPENPDDKWHKLKVLVRRSGVSVRHREGYLADSHVAQPVKWTEEMWRTAFTNPIGSSAIPLTAVCKWTPSGELAITVLADTGALQFLPDGENLKANLEILIRDRAADGSVHADRFTVTRMVPAAKWEAARQETTRYDAIWKPAASATSLRVIVHDVNGGQYGSLNVPLSKVPN
jgi:VWFA-related protein